MFIRWKSKVYTNYLNPNYFYFFAINVLFLFTIIKETDVAFIVNCKCLLLCSSRKQSKPLDVTTLFWFEFPVVYLPIPDHFEIPSSSSWRFLSESGVFPYFDQTKQYALNVFVLWIKVTYKKKDNYTFYILHRGKVNIYVAPMCDP